MAIDVKTYLSPNDGSTTIAAKFDSVSVVLAERSDDILRMVCSAIAEHYVEEHYAEIAAKLDQNAIATLAVADAGKKIAEEIQRRPTVVHETKTRVYQRGILGGLRRIR